MPSVSHSLHPLSFLPSRAQLFEMLPYANRKMVALSFAKSALKFGNKLTSVEDVNRLFAFLRPLLQSEEDQPPEEEMDEVNPAPSLFFALPLVSRLCLLLPVCVSLIIHHPPTFIQEDFEEEQNVVARLVHLFDHESPAVFFQVPVCVCVCVVLNHALFAV